MSETIGECLEWLMTARVDFSSLVVSIDANARWGSMHSHHIGPFYREPQNGNGELLHRFMKDTDLSAASTFCEKSGPTWRYVLLPCSWIGRLHDAGTHYGVNLQLAERVDRFAVFAVVVIASLITRKPRVFDLAASKLLLLAVYRKWRGGMVRNIHKKGPIDVCSNSRGILTSSCVGKVYGRALRRHILPAALNYAADTQCGGFPGRSPEFASHCARLFAARCKARGWSHATVFLDATSAVYSLMRQWVLGFNETEDCLRQVCAKVGIPNADEMISMASRNPILVDAGASRESVALARDWHTGNWISVEHVDEKRFCAKGTRPGDVLADLVFNVAMCWVITSSIPCSG